MRALESALFFEDLAKSRLSISLLSHLSPHLPCSPPLFLFFPLSPKKQVTAHPTHSACSDASKQDIVSATGSPATANAAALANAAAAAAAAAGIRGQRRGGTASNAGSAAGSPGSVGPSRLGGNGADKASSAAAAAAAVAAKVIVAAAEAVGGSGGAGGAGPSSSSGALRAAAASPMAAAGKAKKPTKAQQAAAAAASNPLVRTITPPLQTLHHDPTGSLACFPTPGPPDSPPGGGASRGAAVGARAHRHLEVGDDEELVGPEGMDFDPFGSEEEDDDDNCTQGGGGGSQATGGNGGSDGFVNPLTGKRTRRRVTVATTDADGRPYTQAEIRRMKRRITNRESARRMRLKRQEEWSAAKAQFRALRDDRARLAARAAAAEGAAGAAAHDAARWQSLWRSAAASNLALSRRVAELGGEPAPVVDAATLAALGGEAAVAAAAGGFGGGSGRAGAGAAPAAVAAAAAAAPSEAAAAPVAPKQQQQQESGAAARPIFRDASGLISALLPTPRDSNNGASRPASAGTPRDGAGRRRTTGNGALVGLAASGRAATATLPLPDSDFAGVFGM